MEINVTPRFEDTYGMSGWLKKAYCQNCGRLITARGMPPSSEQVAHENAQLDTLAFLSHLDTHYQDAENLDRKA